MKLITAAQYCSLLKIYVQTCIELSEKIKPHHTVKKSSPTNINLSLDQSEYYAESCVQYKKIHRLDNESKKNESMTHFIEKLKTISENPYLNLIVAFLALCSGIYEVIYELRVAENIRLGAHHGIVLFAFLHILKTIPHLYACMIKIDGKTNIKDDH